MIGTIFTYLLGIAAVVVGGMLALLIVSPVILLFLEIGIALLTEDDEYMAKVKCENCSLNRHVFLKKGKSVVMSKCPNCNNKRLTPDN